MALLVEETFPFHSLFLFLFLSINYRIRQNIIFLSFAISTRVNFLWSFVLLFCYLLRCFFFGNDRTPTVPGEFYRNRVSKKDITYRGSFGESSKFQPSYYISQSSKFEKEYRKPSIKVTITTTRNDKGNMRGSCAVVVAAYPDTRWPIF